MSVAPVGTPTPVDWTQEKNRSTNEFGIVTLTDGAVHPGATLPFIPAWVLPPAAGKGVVGLCPNTRNVTVVMSHDEVGVSVTVAPSLPVAIFQKSDERTVFAPSATETPLAVHPAGVVHPTAVACEANITSSSPDRMPAGKFAFMDAAAVAVVVAGVPCIFGVVVTRERIDTVDATHSRDDPGVLVYTKVPVALAAPCIIYPVHIVELFEPDPLVADVKANVDPELGIPADCRVATVDTTTQFVWSVVTEEAVMAVVLPEVPELVAVGPIGRFQSAPAQRVHILVASALAPSVTATEAPSVPSTNR